MRAMIETKNGRMRSMIHDGSQILNRSIAKLLFGLTAFLVLHTDMVAAQEAVTVQEILTDPALFHLRQITLRGTARNVQPLDPYEIPAGSTCYGGYLFNLEDDTATLPVAVPGLCGRRGARGSGGHGPGPEPWRVCLELQGRKDRHGSGGRRTGHREPDYAAGGITHGASSP